LISLLFRFRSVFFSFSQFKGSEKLPSSVPNVPNIPGDITDLSQLCVCVCVCVTQQTTTAGEDKKFMINDHPPNPNLKEKEKMSRVLRVCILFV
jgi:hypothetical protein